MQRILLTLLLLILATTTGYAQQAQRITLEQAVQIALDNNFALKQAQNNLEQAKNDELSEYADFLPTLNANIGGSQSSGNQFNNNTGEFVNRVVNGFNGGISTGITVFSGLENLYSLRATQQSRISSEESLKRAREDVIFQTVSRFLQVLRQEELLSISQENLVTSQKQLDQIRAQVEVGTRPIVDLYNQESTVASNELAITNNDNQLKFNRLVLVRQLQIDPLANYEFVRPEFGTSAEDLAPEAYQLVQLVNTALGNRSDIKSVEATINALKYQEKIAMGSFLPTISLSGGINSSSNDITRDIIRDNLGVPIGSERVSFNDQFFTRNVRKNIGFSVNWSIFNRLNRKTNLERSKIQYKNAELGLENTRLQVIQETTQAYNDYIGFTKEIESTQKALIASEKAFESQQERYNVGASTLIELSQAQATYVQAQSNYTNAIYNFIFQGKFLEYFLGQLTENNLSLD